MHMFFWTRFQLGTLLVKLPSYYYVNSACPDVVLQYSRSTNSRLLHMTCSSTLEIAVRSVEFEGATRGSCKKTGA